MFAVEQELVEANPVLHVPRPGVERRRDRVLTADELRTFWQKLDVESPRMAAAFRLRLLTAQRGGEVHDLRWADLDLDGAWWTIPGESSKNGLPHRVPLTAPVLKMLRSLRATARPDAVYVLEGARGKRQRSEATVRLALPDFRGHDLRRTATNTIADAAMTAAAASIVFMHSMVDTAAHDYCQICAMLDPSDWYGEVQGEKITLAQARGDWDALVRTAVDREVKRPCPQPRSPCPSAVCGRLAVMTDTPDHGRLLDFHRHEPDDPTDDPTITVSFPHLISLLDAFTGTVLALQSEYTFRDELHVILRDARGAEAVQLRRAIDKTRKEGKSVDRMLVDLREMDERQRHIYRTGRLP